MSALTHLRAAPEILAPGPPGRLTPKKVFPQFFKNLRGVVQVFVCSIRGPPSPVRDKISATVPWPIFAEKNSEILTKIDDFSSYEELAKPKNIWAMRTHTLHKWSKVQPDRFNFRDFSSKKPTFELAAMHSASSEGSKLRLSHDLELWPGCSAS